MRLSSRQTDYIRCGRAGRGGVDSGIPQRSVLGPLFWNLWFNPVLDAPVPGGVCHLLRR